MEMAPLDHIIIFLLILLGFLGNWYRLDNLLLLLTLWLRFLLSVGFYFCCLAMSLFLLLFFFFMFFFQNFFQIVNNDIVMNILDQFFFSDLGLFNVFLKKLENQMVEIYQVLLVLIKRWVMLLGKNIVNRF